VSIEEALHTRLAGHAGLAALVGSRIYPSVLPQGVALPALSYAKSAGPRVHAMGTDPGLARPRFEISCWSPSYAEAKQVAAQARAALGRWRGTVSGVEVLDSFLRDERDDYRADARLHRVVLDVEINHGE